MLRRPPSPHSQRAASTSRRWRTTTASTTGRRVFATRSPPRSAPGSRSSASGSTTGRRTARTEPRSTASVSRSSVRRRCSTTGSSPRGRQGRESPAWRLRRTFRDCCARCARRGQTSETVVVFLHWGVELEQCPSARQRTLAKQLVAAGADVVVGGHAHRVQGAGRLGKALVGYGLGNFVWYSTSELSTQTGVLLVTVDGRRIVGYRWEPARIVDGTPRPLSGAERRSEIASWRKLRGCTGLRP